ncbi:hypothetical protein [Ruegeria sp. Ofav3-42]|uniref:hypothetical protein n=1 Tax=Ruegeria sp. Ofav3-42 TaxID=2917759 RepID=UPI001EF6859E|nr:hypothetical protein [Ruegeria sp. Ofav3-42]MCG7520865.1 hypothetical protein [Ruegeria sp. Ofav3-42]
MSDFVGPVLPVRDQEAEACRRLWCYVLVQAVKLATEVREGDHPAERRHARAWFGTRDFYKVCALAGFDGDYILRGFRAKLAAMGEVD